MHFVKAPPSQGLISVQEACRAEQERGVAQAQTEEEELVSLRLFVSCVTCVGCC